MLANSAYQLKWDSRFFGYPVASIEINEENKKSYRQKIKELLKQKYNLVYVYVEPNDTSVSRQIKKLGGVLVDKKIIYAKKISSAEKDLKVSNNIKSYKNKRVTLKIKNLAISAGKFSRFKVDKHFTNNEYERLYGVWIKKSISGERAKDVLIYNVDGCPAGLVTLEQKGVDACIGLIAVNPKFQRMGIGTSLIHAVFKKAWRLGFKKVLVTTQLDNQPACKLYASNGFKIQSRLNVFHVRNRD